jgi:outer membrane lipoprotein carrier protein
MLHSLWLFWWVGYGAPLVVEAAGSPASVVVTAPSGASPAVRSSRRVSSGQTAKVEVPSVSATVPAVPPVEAAGPVGTAKDDGGTVAADAGVAAADAGAAPAALGAGDVVSRVQAVYDGTTTYQSNFRQVFQHRLNPDRSRTATGVVFLRKPGRMRWEYHSPDRKLIVSDGSTLWVYEPADAQVFEQSLDQTDLPTAVSFLLGSGSLSTEFESRLLEDDRERESYVLELRPRAPSSHYARLVLVVNRSDFHVVRTVVVDHSGNTNSIEFAGEVLNGEIPDSRFRFVRPEGVRVIR